jgi:hypothetical protein
MTLDDFSADDAPLKETHRLAHARREELDGVVDEHDLKVKTPHEIAFGPDYFLDFQDKYDNTRFSCYLTEINGELVSVTIEGIKYRGSPEPDFLVDFIKKFSSAHKVRVHYYDGETIKLEALYN